MSPINGLTIAVPRGALFAGTVDLLASLGVDTAELRANDRKLLFEDVGVITMRPSDVPTYVEAGAADLGVTGKDVLLEQSGAGVASSVGGREVYELLDLAYGRCVMVLEIVSPHTRSNDVVAKRAHYFRARVPLYVVLDWERLGRPRGCAGCIG